MKKKLLFINGHLNTGGVEKALLDVLKHLDYDSYEVDLLLLEELGDYAPDLPEQVSVRLMSLKNTYGSVGQALLRCLRQGDWFCLKMRLILLMAKVFGPGQLRLAGKMLTGGKHYDCAIGFRSGICTKIAAFAVKADRRITWWHHGEINVNRREYEETAGACSQIAVVSDVCREMLVKEFPALESKLVTIPNMLDTETVIEQAAAFTPYEKNGLVHLVSVGRLSPEKHFEDAIYAARRLKEEGLSFRWHLVGDGVLRDRLKQQAEAAQVTDRFLFEGNQVNPYPYLKHADLFVHPSHIESFGIVILEALALGTPCVAVKSAGACELLEDGVTGLLVEKDPDALSEGVLRALTDSVLYRQLKENAYCPEKFLPEQVMGQIEALLSE